MNRAILRAERPVSVASRRPERAPLQWHRQLPEYASTPLHASPTLARALGVEAVWIKDESSRLGLPSFKVLGASWAAANAVARRLGRPVETLGGLEEVSRAVRGSALLLAAATEGNHGRAVARIARWMGLPARIFVPRGTSDARTSAIAAEGAEVVVVAGDYDAAVAEAARLAANGALVISDTSDDPADPIASWVVDGYSTLFWEVDDALAARGEPPVDAVVVPMGVGSLAAAAVRHFRRPGAPAGARVLGVEPVAAACIRASFEQGSRRKLPSEPESIMVGLNCGTPSAPAWPDLFHGIDCYGRLTDDEARRAMRELAVERIVAGETGAASLAGARTARASCTDCRCLARARRLLLLVTEGATDPASYAATVSG